MTKRSEPRARRVTSDEREWEGCVGPTSELTTFTGCDNRVVTFAKGDFYCKKHAPRKPTQAKTDAALDAICGDGTASILKAMQRR